MNIMQKAIVWFKPYGDFIEAKLAKIGIMRSKVVILSVDVHHVPLITTKQPFLIRLATPQDLPLFGSREQKCRHRMEQGDICHIALDGKNLAGYSWITFRELMHIPDVAYDLPILPFQGYQFDAYVFADYRKNNLHKRLIAENMRYAHANGKSAMLTYISLRNIISLKTMHSFVLKPLMQVAYTRIFFIKKHTETKGDQFALS